MTDYFYDSIQIEQSEDEDFWNRLFKRIEQEIRHEKIIEVNDNENYNFE